MQKQQRLDRPLGKLLFLMENYPYVHKGTVVGSTLSGNSRPNTSSAQVTLTPKKCLTTTNSATPTLKRISIIPLTPKEKTKDDQPTPIHSPKLQNRVSFYKRQQAEKPNFQSPKRLFRVSKSKIDSWGDIQTPKSVSSKTTSNSEFCISGRGFLPIISDLRKTNAPSIHPRSTTSIHPRSTTSIVSRNNLDISQDQDNPRILDLLQKSISNSPTLVTNKIILN